MEEGISCRLCKGLAPPSPEISMRLDTIMIMRVCVCIAARACSPYASHLISKETRWHTGDWDLACRRVLQYLIRRMEEAASLDRSLRNLVEGGTRVHVSITKN
jgi:hypothetical protein